MCVLIGLFLIALHVIIFECCLFKYLEKDYSFMRQVFKLLVPEYILLN